MASHSQEERFVPKSPHFFKVILPETLRGGKLVIPKKFVNRYGGTLRSRVMLTVPTSTVWPVEVVKCNGNVCFDLGWEKFSEFYSLEVGHFLVFRYEGNSMFTVIIFDKTAAEIDYPTSKVRDNRQDCEKNKEDLSARRLRSRMEDVTNLQLKKRRRTGSTSGRDELRAVDAEEHCSKPFLGERAAKDGGNVSKTKGKLKFEDRAVGETIDCQLINPFFIVTVCPSALNPKGYLTIPSTFAKAYLKTSMSLILQIPSGQSWTVNCTIHKTSQGNLKTQLVGGWAKFQRDNDLKVNDKCMFELVEDIEMSMKVKIFRFSEEEATGDHPFFQMVMKPSYVGRTANLGIPTNFAKKYLIGVKDVTLVSQSGETWNVKYYCQGPKEASFFTSGWKTFVKDNGLKVGDVCIFKLIKSNGLSLEVSIHRFRKIKRDQ